MDSDRKLVTVRQIDSIDPIPGADAIEVANIEGWQVVVKKGQFHIGDYCLYAEIDSFIPEGDQRFAFLMKSTRTFEGVKGHKLKTIRLRGQLSQGLVLPLTDFPELFPPEVLTSKAAKLALRDVDLAEKLGIKKWEAQIPAQLAGQVKGNFPSFIRKTDQNRAQNLVGKIFYDNLDSRYEVSLKLDGTSITYFYRDGEVGACSRNLQLKINEENHDNYIVKLLRESQLGEALQALGKNIAIQGEGVGTGIQGNRENIPGQRLYVFDVQDIDSGCYYGSEARQGLIAELGLSPALVQHIPVLHTNVTFADLGIANIKDLVAFAEGPSLVNPVREGLVFKRMDGKFSFKIVSNAFLLKEKD